MATTAAARLLGWRAATTRVTAPSVVARALVGRMNGRPEWTTTSNAFQSRGRRSLATIPEVKPLPLDAQESAHAHLQKQQERGPAEAPAKPPEELTLRMADTILEGIWLSIELGHPKQRLQALGTEYQDWNTMSKWSKMMEIYLTAQLLAIQPLGYPPSEPGLELYSQHLLQLFSRLKDSDEHAYYHLKDVKRQTWRHVVSTAFGLKEGQLKEFANVAEAREAMHKVTSVIGSGPILQMAQKRAGRIEYQEDVQIEAQLKHAALQEIIVEHAYMQSGVLRDIGFYIEGDSSHLGDPVKAYANFQCSLADYDEDPLIQEYTKSVMEKLWTAAGLGYDTFAQAGMPEPPAGAAAPQTQT